MPHKDIQLQDEKDRFEALFEFASMGIVVTDDKARIQIVNQFLLTQFGYNEVEELLGKPIEILIPRRYNTCLLYTSRCV